MIAEQDNKHIKAQATRSMIISVYDHEKDMIYNHIRDNFSVSMFIEDGQVSFKLFTKALQFLENNKHYNVLVLCTNDPTPPHAGSKVSLGYYRFLWDFQDFILTETEPPMFKGPVDRIHISWLLPERDN